ncbi:MAG: hypothetical protein AAFQ83_09450 [Bacteroidota bacterium]
MKYPFAILFLLLLSVPAWAQTTPYEVPEEAENTDAGFTFTSKINGHTFSLDLECVPTYEQQSNPTPVGDIKIEINVCEISDDEETAIYINSITHLAEGMIPPGTEKPFLDSYLTGTATGMNGELIEKEDIDFNEFLTSDAVIKIMLEGQTSYVHGRYMLIEGAIYSLQVFNTKEETSPSLKKLWDSFDYE